MSLKIDRTTLCAYAALLLSGVALADGRLFTRRSPPAPQGELAQDLAAIKSLNEENARAERAKRALLGTEGTLDAPDLDVVLLTDISSDTEGPTTTMRARDAQGVTEQTAKSGVHAVAKGTRAKVIECTKQDG